MYVYYTHTHSSTIIHNYYNMVILYHICIHCLNNNIIIYGRGGHVYTAAGACVIKRFIVVRTTAADDYETCC